MGIVQLFEFPYIINILTNGIGPFIISKHIHWLYGYLHILILYPSPNFILIFRLIFGMGIGYQYLIELINIFIRLRPLIGCLSRFFTIIRSYCIFIDRFILGLLLQIHSQHEILFTAFHITHFPFRLGASIKTRGKIGVLFQNYVKIRNSLPIIPDHII